MPKEKTLGEIEDEVKSLNRKRMQMVLELNDMEEQIKKLGEMYYEKSPEYIKITCLGCNGLGYIEGDDKKKVKCQLCNLQKYIWAKKFNGEKTNG